MARPRKDAEGPGARARLIDAFWRLAGTCPAHELSAAAVAEAACVNRGTFYYYFPDMDALIACAIREEVLQDDVLPNVLFTLLVQGDAGALTRDIPRPRLRRVALIMGSGEMHTVITAVREAVHMRWLAALRPPAGELAPASVFAIQFMVSGVLSYIANAAKAEEDAVDVPLLGEAERTYVGAVARETVAAVARAEGMDEREVVARLCGAKRAQRAQRA